MDFLTLFLYFAPAAVLLYLYIHRKYSYWSSQGIPGPPSIFPFGYFHNRFFKSLIDFELEPWRQYGNMYGTFCGMAPVLVIADVDLAKQVLVKDFHLFVNRRGFNFLSKYLEPNLVTVKGQTWKRIRSIVTPAFSAAKLKRMYPLFKEATNKLECYFQKASQNVNNSVDIKQIMSGFSIDVIASTHFGIDTDADTDSNGDHSKFNSFLYHNNRVCNKYSSFKFFLIVVLPKWFLKMLNLIINVEHVFPQDTYDFFINSVLTIIEKGGKEKNMITLLKEASNEDPLDNLKSLTGTAKSDKSTISRKNFLSIEEIVAQCLVFFVAGNETTSTTLTNALFHLTWNPEIQERLYREITDKLSNFDPDDLEPYYDEVSKLPYLDAFIRENLRMFPPVTRTDRTLSADHYDLGGAQLKRGDVVEISILSLHHNPEYFPDPFKFDPERFLPENEHKLVSKDAFLPFGNGPRYCVGMRFAILEMKFCLAALVRKFQFEPNEKTPLKLIFPPSVGVLSPLPYQISVKARE